MSLIIVLVEHRVTLMLFILRFKKKCSECSVSKNKVKHWGCNLFGCLYECG